MSHALTSTTDAPARPGSAPGCEAGRGVVLVEGLPGSGKSSNAHDLGAWLADIGAHPLHWPEGRADHPVDFECVSLLSFSVLAHIREKDPVAWFELRAHAERYPDGWIIRHTDQLTVPPAILAQVRRLDAYDGEITADAHARALAESWRRFGERVPPADVQIWECVLIQNPVCAFIARFDQPAAALERHVQHLVASVREHNPMLVYLDPGDPEPVLRRAAEERPDWWRNLVVDYHTSQGYGLRVGLEGFDGYIEFMRMRRELELDLIPKLDLPSLVVRTADEPEADTRRSIRAFVRAHLVD
ncbi:MAG: hypothetical protein EOO67_02040 [Microbacterium sp.]|nr:MAG: hypothetical protein EOO67_02040 [Microbacterium sp.]